MDPAIAKEVSPTAVEQALGSLAKMFGAARAEHFGEELFGLFTRPNYWPELESDRACILTGGRGTGKTTVLRSLSYKGTSQLTAKPIRDWSYVGLYWRVDTASVAGLHNESIPEPLWMRLFAHYLNLVICQSIAEFVNWMARVEASSTPSASMKQLRRFAQIVGVPDVDSSWTDWLDEAVASAMCDLENYINNPERIDLPKLTTLGRPQALLLEALQADERLAGKNFFFLIDEFENLEGFQQRVVNTAIKHAGDAPLTYKVGVKETGYRDHRTISGLEVLVEPADYANIDISARLIGNDFREFAREVCEARLERFSIATGTRLTLGDLLPNLAESAEAELLAPRAQLSELRAKLVADVDDERLLQRFDQATVFERLLLAYWAELRGASLAEALVYQEHHQGQWANWRNNYQHSMLYTLRRGRPGIRKYYAGWPVYSQMADGNIRFVLQLVESALRLHLLAGKDFRTPVSFENQTLAAQDVGRRNVLQMQGVAVEGGHLTRLTLTLGRLFQMLAEIPEGHTPEITEFRVDWSSDSRTVEKADRLLSLGVMHLAFSRHPANKRGRESAETKDFDYRLHPIFSAFFGCSYRRKRKMTLPAERIVRMSERDSDVLGESLRDQRRAVVYGSDVLPEQLTLFEDFYDGLV